MITVFSHSEAGGHAANEDVFIVKRHPDDPECWICTLGDGQGGQPGGGPAAKLACQSVADLALVHHPQELRNSRTWDAILHQADEIVAADAYAGYTTLIGLCVHDNTLIGAANGDSAIAVFDVMRDGWEVTANQFKNPPVGSGDARLVNFSTELEPPWLVLTMSDGVWKYSRWEKIKEAGSKLHGRKLADELLNSARLARTRKLQDDFTMVVLQNNSREE